MGQGQEILKLPLDQIHATVMFRYNAGGAIVCLRSFTIPTQRITSNHGLQSCNLCLCIVTGWSHPLVNILQEYETGLRGYLCGKPVFDCFHV